MIDHWYFVSKEDEGGQPRQRIVLRQFNVFDTQKPETECFYVTGPNQSLNIRGKNTGLWAGSCNDNQTVRVKMSSSYFIFRASTEYS